jgi:hypothetical protein
MLELYVNCSIHLHGAMFNQLSKRPVLPILPLYTQMCKRYGASLCYMFVFSVIFPLTVKLMLPGYF